MKLPYLAGAECVERLQRLGFRVTHQGRGFTLLRRASSRVVVPEVQDVDEALLGAILRSAGVDTASFWAVRRRSGTYPRTTSDTNAPPTEESAALETARGRTVRSTD